MDEGHRTEQGQAIVLLVLAMVALLGFTALAIDGGMVYSDRRFIQSVADASSLAGGGAAALYLENSHMNYKDWDCADPDVVEAQNQAVLAAIDRTQQNDFTISYNSNLANENHGVDTECVVVDNGSWVDKYIDVDTKITMDTRTSFIHFVYGGPVRNTVHATTRIRPPTAVAFGNAIVALREDCPNTDTGGVHYDGTSDLYVTGGGIFSNACMIAGGSVDVHVPDGPLTCVPEEGETDCYTANGHPTVDPEPDPGTLTLPLAVYSIDPPHCDYFEGSESSVHGSADIGPGLYSDIRLNSSHDVLNMEPGLYCISGDFVANGGTITGNQVTIYIENGDFDIAGGVEIYLTAPPKYGCIDTICPPALPGILIYLPDTNHGEVSLLGTSDSEYLGLVYVPGGTIEAGGTGSELSEIHAQLIGDTVKLHGTTEVKVNFNDLQTAEVPAWLEVSR